LWAVLWISGLLNGLEQEALRWRYLARGEVASTAPILHVDIDAQSVAMIGDRPWDRTNFAILLNALLGPGEAKTVGVDVIFSQLGRGSLLDVERARSGDRMLGQSIAHYNDQVVLAAAYTGTEGLSAVPLIRMGFADPKKNLFPESPSYPIVDWHVGKLGLANVDEELGKGVIPQWVVGFVEVHGELYSRNLMNGMRSQLFDVMNEPQIVEDEGRLVLTDKDGWRPHEIRLYSEHVLYSLGLELFLTANEIDRDDIVRGERYLLIHKDGAVFRKVPLVERQSIGVNWFSGWRTDTFTEHVGMHEVLERAGSLSSAMQAGDTAAVDTQKEWFMRFKDKVIFVGPVDPQLKDVAPTPFNREPVPKVGLHANLYRTLHAEAYIAYASNLHVVLIVFSLTLLVALLALWNRPGRFAAVLLVCAYALFVFSAFSLWHLVLPLIAPLGAAMTAVLGIMLIKLGAEEFERRRIKNLFGAYVSPELVNEMVEAQRDPQLGGVDAEISSLFSDVEGFSALSEQLEPNQLVALMNEYLGAMTEEIQKQGGTLDKYIGDAIVTMFGMPVPLENHAGRACLAALRMQERHAKLREHWQAAGKWPDAVLRMRTRIGINCGVAVIGNMGSEVRFNYTMMGDSVNVAARCESAAKSYGVYTMVTDAVLRAAEATAGSLPKRKLDRIVVKGRSQAVEVFELWDQSVDLSQAEACRMHYESGLALYFEGQWADAIECFEKAAAFEPGSEYASTTPSAVMRVRCLNFLKLGAPADWDGVYRMQTK